MMIKGYGPFWQRNGVCFRSPDDITIGITEALPEIKQHYGYVLFDPKTGSWEAERKVCLRLGIDYGVWTRIRSADDLHLLLNCKKDWNGCKAIAPNPEIGNGGPGSTRDAGLMHNILFTMSMAGKGIVLTDGWADPIGKWNGFRSWVGAVECFPEDDRRLTDIHGCLLHAGAYFRAVVVMLAAYGTGWLGRKPVLADYRQNLPLDVPRIIFTGDDVEDWRKW